ncbi:hypothetical protein [Paenibacillus sp. JJ-100]|uniref:hypothetical protein n=1 Tax=Paenibacillus sp. JJ-100 TaxID=2974896 RepID=UPI00232AFC15|nr:hypothetical protein [Paenibacillus sp. JJ-100]
MPPQQRVQHGISPRAFGYGIVPNARTKGRDGTTSRPFFTTKLKLPLLNTTYNVLRE